MSKEPFRVLCLDGGGMRGLYSATLLSTLAYRFDSKFSKTSPDLGKAFDLICGTSTGSILACGLAVGAPLTKIRELYIKFGSSIFPKPKPKSRFQFYLWSAKHAKKPSADPSELRNALARLFGDTTIRELYENRKIALCVPAINASTYKAWVFKTPHNPGKHRDDNYTLVDVCMASAAAPILFPLAQIKDPDDHLTETQVKNFVDGGLWANNPILVGLIEAMGLVDQQKQKIDIVSIGTCDQPSGDPYSVGDPNWGIVDWEAGINIVEMSLAAQSFGYSNAAIFLAKNLSRLGLETRVVRLKQTNKSPKQYSAIGIDKADKIAIDTLNEMAKTDADAIHSEVMREDPGDLALIQEIFSTLTEI